MESTDNEPDASHRVGVQDIKFRPSNNFKNMKYKIKSKKNYDDGLVDTSPSTSEEATDQEPVKAPMESYKPKVQTPSPREQNPLQQKQPPLSQKQSPVPQKQQPLSQKQAPLPQKQSPLTQKEAPLPQKQAPIPQKQYPLPQKQPQMPQKQSPLPHKLTPSPQQQSQLLQKKPSSPLKQPPLPQNQPPLPQTQPPLPKNQPPLPRNQPPLPQNQPPLPKNQPSLPQNQPPFPQNQPPLPQNQPPLPQNQPPLPQNQPTLPQNKPPLPQNQPPLPQSRPPIVQPTLEPIKIKQEVVDPEYKMPNADDEFKVTNQTKQTKTVGGKKICRDFLGGKCYRSRFNACDYAHVFDKDMIQSAFTFCKDFQNKGCCSRPNCRFAHANVFEEGHFRRTGYMPPHAIAHIKDLLTMPPTPPGEDCVPAPAPKLPAPMQNDFSNPPPPIQHIPVPVSLHTPIRPILEPSAINREWIKDVAPVRDTNILQNALAKKCGECENKGFRLQYYKEKVETMLRSSQELKDKIAAVDNKTQRLQAFLAFLDHVKNH